MSALPGKVRVVGNTTVHGERVFALEMLQGRDPSWVGRPFFARFDPGASWLDDLEPAFGEEHFFFDHGHAAARPGKHRRPLHVSGQPVAGPHATHGYSTGTKGPGAVERERAAGVDAPF